MIDRSLVTYNVDIVMCIDCTWSMDNILSIVKDHALSFYEDVRNRMTAKRKCIDNLRVRLVAFRDYKADDEPMLITDFLQMPMQADVFNDCVSCLEATGGGDEPEDGLEALAYSIRSDWDHQGIKRRHIIILWTDASAHELGFGKNSKLYPHNMAKDFSELSEWWGDTNAPAYMDQAAKRLLLFAPDVGAWRAISEGWDNVVHYPSEAGEGLADVDYQQILDCIANSI